VSRPTLWHIPISHYSEKVRWALAHKGVEHDRRAPIPGYHMAVALALTRGRHYTFPVIELDGRRIGDSTTIISALERRHPELPLYPADEAERHRALELEDWFDEQLGPYVRRFAFHSIRDDREQFADLASRQVPAPLRRYRRVTVAYGRAFTGVRFGAASERRADQALEKVLAALDHLESELGDNEYLVGERFTVADLTAAALFFPLVLPPEGPVQLELPPAVANVREPLQDRRGFRWVQEMFRRHRRPTPTTAGAVQNTATPMAKASTS
jgi:glutathione S-transferase